MPSVGRLIEEAEKAFNSVERQNQLNQWNRIARYMLPNQSGLFHAKEVKGSIKTEVLFDSTAIHANRDLANALQSILINPALKWGKAKIKDDELNKDSEVRKYLESASDKVLSALAASNFYPEAARAFPFLTSMGNMILHQEEIDPDNPKFVNFNFKAIHLANVAWLENHLGIPDKLFHKYEYTLRQIDEKFGNIPESLAKAYKESPDQVQNVLMSLYPDKGEDTYTATYIEMETQEILKTCLLYTSPSPRDRTRSRMPSSA